MKFEIPKIVKVLNVGEYAEELKAVKLVVWINPPRGLLKRYFEWVEKVGRVPHPPAGEPHPPAPSPTSGEGGEEGEGEKREEAEMARLTDEVEAIFAELWSAGPDEGTHWTAEEIDRLIEGMGDTDPQLWPWLRDRTLAMIWEHRERTKKG